MLCIPFLTPSAKHYLGHMNTIKLVDFICLLPLSSMYRLFCCINLLLCKTYICTQTLSWDSSWAMLDFLHDSLVGWGETANYMPFFCVFHHLDTGASDDRQIILITIINTLALLITILTFFFRSRRQAVFVIFKPLI